MALDTNTEQKISKHIKSIKFLFGLIESRFNLGCFDNKIDGNKEVCSFINQYNIKNGRKYSDILLWKLTTNEPKDLFSDATIAEAKERGSKIKQKTVCPEEPYVITDVIDGKHVNTDWFQESDLKNYLLQQFEPLLEHKYSEINNPFDRILNHEFSKKDIRRAKNLIQEEHELVKITSSYYENLTTKIKPSLKKSKNTYSNTSFGKILFPDYKDEKDWRKKAKEYHLKYPNMKIPVHGKQRIFNIDLEILEQLLKNDKIYNISPQQLNDL